MKVLVLNGPTWAGSAAGSPRSTAPPPTPSSPSCARRGAATLGLEVEVRQTNHEGELLDWLNAAADERTPVVLNAAAWTHYSYAIFDACAQLAAPLVEVHISDPPQRPEEFRHTSVVTPHAVEVIAGHGIDGYRMALEVIARLTAPTG